jgi:ribosomal subunit interface protein
MNINVVAKNMELTDPIKDYVEKKITDLGKLLTRIEEEGGEVHVDFEVSKNTQHHKSGDIFHADCKINVAGQEYYLGVDKPDMYEAIDAVKDGLYVEINRERNKKQTLFKRGARRAKNILKGLTGS